MSSSSTAQLSTKFSLAAVVLRPFHPDRLADFANSVNLFALSQPRDVDPHKPLRSHKVIQLSKRLRPISTFRSSKASVMLLLCNVEKPCLLHHSQLLPKTESYQNSVQITSNCDSPVLQHVRYLLVQIQSTTCSRPPCITGLEVWIRNAPQEWRVHRSTLGIGCSAAVAPTTSAEVDSSETSAQQDSACLPEECLDMLTQEPLLQPILLPSGKRVNRHTLEQFWRHQAQHAGKDPFTLCPMNVNELHIDFAYQRFVLNSIHDKKALLPVSGFKQPTVMKLRSMTTPNELPGVDIGVPPRLLPESALDGSDGEDSDDREEAAVSHALAERYRARVRRSAAVCCGVCRACARTGYEVTPCGQSLRESTRMCQQCARKLLSKECPLCHRQHKASEFVKCVK